MRIPSALAPAALLLSLAACTHDPLAVPAPDRAPAAVRAPDADLASVPPRSNEPNAVALLAGKAPGLTVAAPSGRNAGSHVVIRCGGATSPENPPLFIVDGVRLRGGQGEATHPEDIVAVSIVKGPAAVALYGAEARYGAVLIETRRRSTAADRRPT